MKKTGSKDWMSDFKEILTEGELNNEKGIIKAVTVGNNVRTHICKLWDGVIIWANEIHLNYIEYPGYDMSNLKFTVLNICQKGRCEVNLVDDKYIYMVPGSLCISNTVPKDGYIYPGELYEGIEIAFDLDALKQQSIPELTAYGLEVDDITNCIKNNTKSYIASVSDIVMDKSKALYDALRNKNLSIQEYKFYVLDLLFNLRHGGITDIRNKSLVTKGQRSIAVEAERIITKDISKHYTVEEIAGRFNVSPSALKKYFDAVYGMPISYYVKEKRMKKAMEMLVLPGTSVGEVANHCGYENQGKFGAAFKAYVGTTPLEYRRIQTAMNMSKIFE